MSYAYSNLRPPRADAIYECICNDPLPEPVRLFGCVMPGFPVCRRCKRPVRTTAAPGPPSPVSSSPGEATELA